LLLYKFSEKAENALLVYKTAINFSPENGKLFALIKRILFVKK